MTSLAPSVYDLPHLPLPSNSSPTDTLSEQATTERLISQLLQSLPPALTADEQNTTTASTSHSPTTRASLPIASATTLRKADHVPYICSTMYHLPAPYVSLDASRPWLLYWTMHSLDLLGCAVDQHSKDRAISTLLHFLSPLGGFAGGPSNTQLPHLLPTYASTCSLAIVGSAQPGGAWQELAQARQATYDFFMRCKRPDGGFVVCEGGEVDVRGTYCLLVVATLLDILTPELVHNVDKFIAACQTYEGGFACASFPFTTGPGTFPGQTSNDSPGDYFRAAQAEAHGGYTSCSINSHFLLSSMLPPTPTGRSSVASLDPAFPAKIDVKGAMRWSAFQQGEAIEAGGFRGRSNKLVDGCYSWWVGGGFPVLDALARKEREDGESVSIELGAKGEARTAKDGERGSEQGKSEGEWEDVPTTHPGQPFNHVALQQYVLLAAQKESGGGLRDKPGKRPDLYHTCNNLSGLSIAQHHLVHSSSTVQSNRARFDKTKGFPAIKPTKPEGGWKSEEERQAVRREVWANALGWEEVGECLVGGKESRVNTTTPVFNILGLRLKPFINFFYGQE